MEDTAQLVRVYSLLLQCAAWDPTQVITCDGKHIERDHLDSSDAFIFNYVLISYFSLSLQEGKHYKMLRDLKENIF